MSQRPSLVTALKDKQRDLGESDERFAARLDIDREMWRRVRRGLSQPGSKTIAGALRAFPDLVLHTVDFFTSAKENTFASDANVDALTPS